VVKKKKQKRRSNSTKNQISNVQSAAEQVVIVSIAK
jgi:hypothetical protein